VSGEVNAATPAPYHPPLALAVAVAAGTLLGLAKNMALGAWKADNAKAVAS
jgi:hypothetical protein